MSDELRDKVISVLIASDMKEWHEQADAVLDIREIRESLEEAATLKRERDEARAALAAAQAREAKLREAVADLLEHVETEHCDVIGAIQEARAALASPAPEVKREMRCALCHEPFQHPEDECCRECFGPPEPAPERCNYCGGAHDVKDCAKCNDLIARHSAPEVKP